MTTLSQLQQRRARDHQDLGYTQPAHPVMVESFPDDPELHRQHVLPGARRAITHAQLAEWQAEGITEAHMALRVNGQA